jgi:hypothetical protein
MLNGKQVLRALVLTVVGSMFALAHAAVAQTFTMTPSTLSPANLIPGETATATIQITTTNGFTGSVALTCAVAPPVTTGAAPTCLPSPASVTPDATDSLTVTANGAPAGEYTFTITATSGSETETATLYLTVVDVPADYTLTITRPVSPSTVSAGNGATATILVTPVAGYSGSVTLSCESITPVVLAAPICAFSPQPVVIVNGAAPPATLTISTYGTTTDPVAKASRWRIFYAFWWAVPALALIGTGATSAKKGKKGRTTLMGLIFLMAVASSLLFLPSCNSTSTTSNTSNTSNLVTPKNTYTITLNGVDANGISPGNTTGTGATVTLIVN